MSSTFANTTFLLTILIAAEILAAEMVKIGSFQDGKHGVRGDVFVLDNKTLQIENFYYDGKCKCFSSVKETTRLKELSVA